MASVRTVVWFSALTLAAAAARAQEAGFWLTGLPAAAGGGEAVGLSGDGLVAVGNTGGGTQPRTAGFTWTRQGGRDDFGLLPGMPTYSPAYAASGDGSVIAGYLDAGPGPRAYRRVGSGPLENLGLLPGTAESKALGVSGDGQRIVGSSTFSSGGFRSGQAFLWTPQGGMQGLGFTRPGGWLSEANGISRDGSTVVGSCVTGGPFGPQDAFVWTQSGGMRALPQLPGAPFASSSALAANASGGVIVGQTPGVSGQPRPVRWSAAGVEDLGLPAEFRYGFAWTVSDDGTVVGGDGYDATNSEQALLWTPSTGVELLSDYLAASGVSVPAGYRLEEVRAISGDGRTFAGLARSLSTNQGEGFVATVPSPSSVLVLILPALQRRRRALV